MYQSIRKDDKNEQSARRTNTDARVNLTGIPLQMKESFESRSGFSFDNVKVHYNSHKPAQLHALAYTQGNEVHIGPGQEKHLAHELGHVVQQKSGLVKPTSVENGFKINNDPALESSADQFGTVNATNPVEGFSSGGCVIQKCDPPGSSGRPAAAFPSSATGRSSHLPPLTSLSESETHYSIYQPSTRTSAKPSKTAMSSPLTLTPPKIASRQTAVSTPVSSTQTLPVSSGSLSTGSSSVSRQLTDSMPLQTWTTSSLGISQTPATSQYATQHGAATRPLPTYTQRFTSGIPPAMAPVPSAPSHMSPVPMSASMAPVPSHMPLPFCSVDVLMGFELKLNNNLIYLQQSFSELASHRSKVMLELEALKAYDEGKSDGIDGGIKGERMVSSLEGAMEILHKRFSFLQQNIVSVKPKIMHFSTNHCLLSFAEVAASSQSLQQIIEQSQKTIASTYSKLTSQSDEIRDAQAWIKRKKEFSLKMQGEDISEDGQIRDLRKAYSQLYNPPPLQYIIDRDENSLLSAVAKKVSGAVSEAGVMYGKASGAAKLIAPSAKDALEMVGVACVVGDLVDTATGIRDASSDPASLTGLASSGTYLASDTIAFTSAVGLTGTVASRVGEGIAPMASVLGAATDTLGIRSGLQHRAAAKQAQTQIERTPLPAESKSRLAATAKYTEAQAKRDIATSGISLTSNALNATSSVVALTGAGAIASAVLSGLSLIVGFVGKFVNYIMGKNAKEEYLDTRLNLRNHMDDVWDIAQSVRKDDVKKIVLRAMGVMSGEAKDALHQLFMGDARMIRRLALSKNPKIRDVGISLLGSLGLTVTGTSLPSYSEIVGKLER